MEVGITSELACQVQEGLFEVVVGFGTDFVVLQVLFAMERHLLRLHLSVLHVHLVSTQHDGYVFTHARQVPVPGRHVLVREPRRDVEHDDGTVPVDVVSITQPTKLLLSSRVPAVVPDLSSIGVKVERTHLHTDGGFVFLLELSCPVTFHERGLACATVAHEQQLEVGHASRRLLSWKRHGRRCARVPQPHTKHDQSTIS
mmetsp:Transcript_5680/g.19873  ORF Transcript_5680/g.19873 Transcript_5680/m.19873 type:complete len:200 (-) Transcript_5680:19-618(-)